MQLAQVKVRKLSWFQALGAAVDPFAPPERVKTPRMFKRSTVPESDAIQKSWQRTGYLLRLAMKKAK